MIQFSHKPLCLTHLRDLHRIQSQQSFIRIVVLKACHHLIRNFLVVIFRGDSWFRVRLEHGSSGLAMAELRQDRLRQRWIVVSEDCERRQSESRSDREEGLNSGPCAFCAGFEHETGREILTVSDNDEPWHVRVTLNKFPAVSMDVDGGLQYDGCCRLPAFGSHEVFIETPHHQLSLPELPASHIAQVPTILSIHS